MASRGPNLAICSGVGGALTPLRKYIEQQGVSDQRIAQQIKSQLYNYRHRRNHTRRVLTQKEHAFLDRLIELQFAMLNQQLGDSLRQKEVTQGQTKTTICPRGLHDEPCNCQETRRAWFNPATGTSEGLTPSTRNETQKTPEPLYNYITLTDHLELLLGKTIKHETFPLEGVITNINNETITIKFNKDFAGEHTTIMLSETDGFLIKEPKTTKPNKQ